MTKIKDNFLLSTKHKKLVDKLPDEQAGKLFKNIYSYANDKTYDLSGALESVFLIFQEYMDFNEKKYLKRKEYDGKRQEEKKLYSQENDVKRSENDNFHTLPITHIYNNLENNRGVIGEKEETFNSTDDTSMLGEIEEKKVADDTGLLAETTKKIIKYLNEKAETKYRASSKATQSKINARLNEGYKLDDFIVVIDKKYNEWHGTEFEKFLCPETLFGSKFEKYLNQKINQKRNNLPQVEIAPLPEWIDKKIEKQQASEEEIAEMEELLKEFKE